MTEKKFDPSSPIDIQIALIDAEIIGCYRRIEQLSEILTKIGEAKGDLDTEKHSPAKNEGKQLPGTDFDKLSWKSYATKQAAGPEEAGWIFANTQGAEALLSTLKSKDGKATIGAFEYTIQGKEHQFISRNPVK